MLLTVPVLPFVDIERVPDPKWWFGGLPVSELHPEVQVELFGPPVKSTVKFLVVFRLTLSVEPEWLYCATVSVGKVPIGLPVALLVVTP